MAHPTVSPPLVALLLLLVIALASSPARIIAAKAPGRALYVVRLNVAPPLVSYRGGIAGFPATAAWPADDDSEDEGGATSGGNSTNNGSVAAAAAAALRTASTLSRRLFRRRPFLNMRAPHVRAFAAFLQRVQMQVAADVGLAVKDLIYNYLHVSNGFAASLTPLQKWRLERHPSVAAVTESRRWTALTNRSPAFLELPSTVWASAGGESSAGAGMVVGVVDTGVWPEHPSFAEESIAAPPSSWSGSCVTTSDFPSSLCTNKLVGARTYNRGFAADYGAPEMGDDWPSARDSNGHGTWCAGAAVGNLLSTTSPGTVSGMAPAAHLAVYKVFWAIQGQLTATSADIYAAVNDAMRDGVHVLSLSLGGSSFASTYFDDLPFLRANEAGMIVAFAAGNAGPPRRLRPLSYRTIDNFSPFYLTVGASTISSSRTMSGASMDAAAAAAGTAPALTASAVLTALQSSNSSSTPSSSPSSSSSSAATPAAIAAPMVADFSSVGPLTRSWKPSRNSRATNNVLKPDILGPGVNLLAASPPADQRLVSAGGFASLSGTSMSTPHIAGIAALVVQAHPDWSPAQVMSAIMTTARVQNVAGQLIRNSYGEVATPWEMGSGHVYPARVLDPGLTYNAGVTQYQNFLAGQSMVQARREFKGKKLRSVSPSNLNRPTISVGRLRRRVGVQRTVTNVADAASTYSVRIVQPVGVEVSVSPKRFTIAPGATVTYTVTLQVKRVLRKWTYGSLTWEDGQGHVVRSAIAAQPVSRF